jgi:hypothetical protein
MGNHRLHQLRKTSGDGDLNPDCTLFPRVTILSMLSRVLFPTQLCGKKSGESNASQKSIFLFVHWLITPSLQETTLKKRLGRLHTLSLLLFKGGNCGPFTIELSIRSGGMEPCANPLDESSLPY